MKIVEIYNKVALEHHAKKDASHHQHTSPQAFAHRSNEQQLRNGAGKYKSQNAPLAFDKEKPKEKQRHEPTAQQEEPFN